MTSGSGVRTLCGVIMAVACIALGPSGAGAEDLPGGGQVEASDIGNAAGVETASRGSRLWTRQPGTKAFDAAADVATDKHGNLYVVGDTEGALAGTNEGRTEAWVIKFDGNGRRIWARQFGAGLYSSARAVATDDSGNAYIAGWGGDGQWVIKLGVDGQQLWKRTVDPLHVGIRLFPVDIATDKAGNVYAVGYDEIDEAFVIKLDREGNVLWTRQPGTSSGQGVAADKDGNVYVVGTTCSFCDTNASVIKLDREGNVLWTRQPGTSDFDAALDVATDERGNVYVVGVTEGSSSNGWLIKFAGDGRRLWGRQPGTRKQNAAVGVTTNKFGNIYLVGTAGGNGLVIAFDSDGDRVWTRQPEPSLVGVAADKVGNIYVVGWGSGRHGLSDSDAWVIKYAK